MKLLKKIKNYLFPVYNLGKARDPRIPPVRTPEEVRRDNERWNKFMEKENITVKDLQDFFDEKES